jgi:peptidyl-tRNA hydrolase
MDPAEFVLARFAPDEIEAREAMIRTAAEAVVFTIDHRFDEAMSTYNANPAWLPPTDGDQAV